MSGVMGGQAVVGTGRLGLRRDVDCGSGGGRRGVGGGDGRDGDRDGGIIRSEDTVANVIFGTEHNSPLAYAPGLELHHSIMSKLG